MKTKTADREYVRKTCNFCNHATRLQKLQKFLPYTGGDEK
jgi:hypothetical protein